MANDQHRQPLKPFYVNEVENTLAISLTIDAHSPAFVSLILFHSHTHTVSFVHHHVFFLLPLFRFAVSSFRPGKKKVHKFPHGKRVNADKFHAFLGFACVYRFWFGQMNYGRYFAFYDYIYLPRANDIKMKANLNRLLCRRVGLIRSNCRHMKRIRKKAGKCARFSSFWKLN